MLSKAGLRKVPQAQAAGTVVQGVRSALDLDAAKPFHPEDVMRKLGWRVRRRRLQASVGGTRALLLPCSGGKFECIVDPDPAPEERWLLDGLAAEDRRGALDSILRQRAAHEFAHALFYRQPAGRGTPVRSCPSAPHEEEFCDAFAAAALTPPEEEPSTDAAARVAALVRSGKVALPVALQGVALDTGATMFAGTFTAGELRLRLRAGPLREPPSTAAVAGAAAEGSDRIDGWWLATHKRLIFLAG